MLQKKKENQRTINRKEIAQQIEKDKIELAAIRTEQAIRDDNMVRFSRSYFHARLEDLSANSVKVICIREPLYCLECITRIWDLCNEYTDPFVRLPCYFVTDPFVRRPTCT